MYRKSLFGFITLFFCITLISVKAQPTRILNSSEIKLALKKLSVLGKVLYIGAHPDDENTAVLSYLSSGKLFDAAYLALTRGDGGQNLIGTEQAEALGVIRTQELLAARRIDGAKQFFTRAVDFGYSKSAKETFQIWDSLKILSDVVWIIRNFKPDIIITRFPITGEGGHGQHTASAIFARQAFDLAGDSSIFTEQLKFASIWKPKRLFLNAWRGIGKEKDPTGEKTFQLDLSEFNPLLGKSYTEIAAESRSMHKSQGFGVSANRDKSVNDFILIKGDIPENSMFDGIDFTWNKIKGGRQIDSLLHIAINNFDDEKPSASVPILLNVLKELNSINNNDWVEIKKQELLKIIQSSLGLWIESIAENYYTTTGENLNIKNGIVNRTELPVILKNIIFSTGEELIINKKLLKEDFTSFDYNLSIPDNINISQPYWLKSAPEKETYFVENQTDIGKPENDPAITTKFIFSLFGNEFELSSPVLYRWNSQTSGESYRNLEIRPPVVINLDKKVYLFPDANSREIAVTLISNKNSVSGALNIELPVGWKSDYKHVSFKFTKKDERRKIKFNINPSSGESVGEVKFFVSIKGSNYAYGMQEINFAHIPIQSIFPPSKAKVVRVNVKKVANKIAYIMGSGDKIPDILKELGYQITELNDDNILNDDLNSYDAIITGIRAYNTRDVLAIAQSKLIKYVKNGGTLLVQYNVVRPLVTEMLGPYPIELSHDRVTEEDAKVTILDKDNLLINFPNKISEKDFDGWIQERGLYFPDKWDKNYKTVFSCNDFNEKPKQGGILFSNYGNGFYIYTGFSFFRELPAGVPGAIKLFVNLFSAGKRISSKTK